MYICICSTPVKSTPLQRRSAKVDNLIRNGRKCAKIFGLAGLASAGFVPPDNLGERTCYSSSIEIHLFCQVSKCSRCCVLFPRTGQGAHARICWHGTQVLRSTKACFLTHGFKFDVDRSRCRPILSASNSRRRLPSKAGPSSFFSALSPALLTSVPAPARPSDEV